jgi:hypothetical protein
MLRYMLDTDISSYIMNRASANVIRRLEAAAVGDVCVSAITRAELMYGVEVSPRRAKDQNSLDIFLQRQCAERGNAGAEQGGFVVGGRTSREKLCSVVILTMDSMWARKVGQVDPADVVAGEVEAAGAGEVDEGRGGGGEGAVPQVDELAAALVALLCVGKNLFRLEIEEAHAHGAVAHDAFKVADAAAAAVALFGVEGDGDVPALPHAFNVRPAAVADAVADGPDAGELFERPWVAATPAAMASASLAA